MEVDTYRIGQEKSPHGANMGLSGKVLYLRKKCYFNPTAGSVEAPLPSGYYSRHHERAGSQMGQQHQAAGYLLQILTGVASAAHRKP